jgi:hypothetical protein
MWSIRCDRHAAHRIMISSRGERWMLRRPASVTTMLRYVSMLVMRHGVALLKR